MLLCVIAVLYLLFFFCVVYAVMPHVVSHITNTITLTQISFAKILRALTGQNMHDTRIEFNILTLFISIKTVMVEIGNKRAHHKRYIITPALVFSMFLVLLVVVHHNNWCSLAWTYNWKCKKHPPNEAQFLLFKNGVMHPGKAWAKGVQYMFFGFVSMLFRASDFKRFFTTSYVTQYEANHFFYVVVVFVGLSSLLLVAVLLVVHIIYSSHSLTHSLPNAHTAILNQRYLIWSRFTCLARYSSSSTAQRVSEEWNRERDREEKKIKQRERPMRQKCVSKCSWTATTPLCGYTMHNSEQ